MISLSEGNDNGVVEFKVDENRLGAATLAEKIKCIKDFGDRVLKYGTNTKNIKIEIKYIEIGKNRIITEETKGKIAELQEEFTHKIAAILKLGEQLNKVDEKHVFLIYHSLVYKLLKNLNYRHNEKKITQREYCRINVLKREPTLSDYLNKYADDEKFEEIRNDLEKIFY